MKKAIKTIEIPQKEYKRLKEDLEIYKDEWEYARTHYVSTYKELEEAKRTISALKKDINSLREKWIEAELRCNKYGSEELIERSKYFNEQAKRLINEKLSDLN